MTDYNNSIEFINLVVVLNTDVIAVLDNFEITKLLELEKLKKVIEIYLFDYYLLSKLNLTLIY